MSMHVKQVSSENHAKSGKKPSQFPAWSSGQTGYECIKTPGYLFFVDISSRCHILFLTAIVNQAWRENHHQRPHPLFSCVHWMLLKIVSTPRTSETISKIYIYICVCICVHLCIYKKICISIHIYIYIHTYTIIWICMHTCIYIYIYVYICIHIYMYIHIYIYIYTYTYLYTYLCIYTYICIFINIYMNTYRIDVFI